MLTDIGGREFNYQVGIFNANNQLDRHLRNAYYMYSHNRTKENDMNYEKTLENMRKYGGSFVQQLARLWFVADQGNRDKLEAAFSDIFDKYENI